jgi:Nif-specific regulatory protein
VGVALNALLKISSTVNRLRKVEAIVHELLRLLLEVAGAERVGLLLFSERAGGVASTLAYRRSGEREDLHIDRSILDEALGDRVAVLFGELVEAEANGEVGGHGGPMMCVPMLGLSGPLGVLYVDSGSPDQLFGELDLQLVAAIGGIASTAVENARRVEWLEGERNRLRLTELEHNMIGVSEAMQRVFETIARAAPTPSTVLVLGESGTGKELAARAIHQNSPRSEGPFVAINCATLSPELLESDLFGHEQGAFTGAVGRKRGKLEVAHCGTIFLDEIGELPASLQPKLLRVLEERQFERVGGNRTIDVDIRLIAATNLDLERAICEGDFRQDLYYRLNVISLTMPPLRDRREDILPLAEHFVAVCGAGANAKGLGISPRAAALLSRYDWPGNVRELANCIERAVVLGHSHTIRVEDLPEALHESESASASSTRYHEALVGLKRRLIVDAVRAAEGNITQAARELGVHPNYLHRLIRNLDLRDQI